MYYKVSGKVVLDGWWTVDFESLGSHQRGCERRNLKYSSLYFEGGRNNNQCLGRPFRNWVTPKNMAATTPIAGMTISKTSILI